MRVEGVGREPLSDETRHQIVKKTAQPFPPFGTSLAYCV